MIGCQHFNLINVTMIWDKKGFILIESKETLCICNLLVSIVLIVVLKMLLMSYEKPIMI